MDGFQNFLLLYVGIRCRGVWFQRSVAKQSGEKRSGAGLSDIALCPGWMRLGEGFMGCGLGSGVGLVLGRGWAEVELGVLSGDGGL